MATMEKKRLLHAIKVIIFCGLFFAMPLLADDLSREDREFLQQYSNIEQYANEVKAEMSDFKAPCLKDLSSQDIDFMHNAHKEAMNISQQQLKQQQEKMNINTYSSQVLIFLSFSMPDVAIKQWLLQAEKIHAPVLIKGLINNSIKDTVGKINEFVNENSKAGIYIDPVRFKQFNIIKVPAVVLTEKIDPLCVGDSCTQSPFVVVYGNASLNAALEHMEKNSELSELAGQQLELLKGHK